MTHKNLSKYKVGDVVKVKRELSPTHPWRKAGLRKSPSGDKWRDGQIGRLEEISTDKTDSYPFRVRFNDTDIAWVHSIKDTTFDEMAQFLNANSPKGHVHWPGCHNEDTGGQ